MMNVNKYTKGYFMPPTVDMSWTQKEYVDKAPTWCSVCLLYTSLQSPAFLSFIYSERF